MSEQLQNPNHTAAGTAEQIERVRNKLAERAEPVSDRETSLDGTGVWSDGRSVIEYTEPIPGSYNLRELSSSWFSGTNNLESRVRPAGRGESDLVPVKGAIVQDNVRMGSVTGTAIEDSKPVGDLSLIRSRRVAALTFSGIRSQVAKREKAKPRASNDKLDNLVS